MLRSTWSEATDFDTVRRRAGGRRRYNAWRQFVAHRRRFRVSELHLELDPSPIASETCSILATRLGVHRLTIWRDIWSMLRAFQPGHPCRLCRCEVRHLARPGLPEFANREQGGSRCAAEAGKGL